MAKMPICEVCNKNESVGIASVPGVPISCAYCKECLAADAHPWAILVANTACGGGLEHCAPWWHDMVMHTCKHLGRTLEDFEQEVEQSIKELDELTGGL